MTLWLMRWSLAVTTATDFEGSTQIGIRIKSIVLEYGPRQCDEKNDGTTRRVQSNR